MKVSTRADDSDKHEFDVNHLLFHKGKLYTGGDEGKIKVWSPDLKKLAEVQAHPCSVYCLAASSDTLYSCCNDGTIKAWELETLKEKCTLFNDSNTEIWRICFGNECLYSGDHVGNIRVFKNNKLYGELNIAEPIKDMLVHGTSIYTVKDLDLSVTEIKIEGEKLQYGTKGSMTGKSPVTLIGEKLFAVASRSGMDVLIHETAAETRYKKVTEIKGAHEMIINALAGVEWDGSSFLFSGGWDKTLKKWKIQDGQAKVEGSCGLDIVINAITFGDKGLIYVGGGDGHIVRVDA